MARFHGNIGFVLYEETDVGVFSERSVVRPYFGDIKRHGYRWDHGYGINDHPIVTNYIEIVADAFAYENIGAMRWVEWNGVKWQINSAEINRPRITLTFSGVYNATEQDSSAPGAGDNLGDQ